MPLQEQVGGDFAEDGDGRETEQTLRGKDGAELGSRPIKDQCAVLPWKSRVAQAG
jgi:hypothetical protein